MPQTQYPRQSFPRKPVTPLQQLKKAIQRAQENGVKVAMVGKILATGQPCYLVPSQTLEGMHHVVSRAPDGSLQCDCLFYREKHGVCAHRAAAFLFLQDQANKPKLTESVTLPAYQLSKTPISEELANMAQPIATSQPAVKKITPAAAPVPASVVASLGPQVADAWEAYQDSRRNGDWE
jgi:hypothetical protein